MWLESISLWHCTTKATFWWWTLRMQAFYFIDEKFSIEHTMVVSSACLIVSLSNVHGFFTTPKVFMNPLMISFWATTNFELCLNVDFGTKSTIVEFISIFCIIDLLERVLGKKCNYLLMDCKFK